MKCWLGINPFWNSRETYVSPVVSFPQLRDAGLKLRMSKCKFFARRAKCLRHTVSENDIESDPDKVRVMKSLKTTTDVKEIRSFLVWLRIIGASRLTSRKSLGLSPNRHTNLPNLYALETLGVWLSSVPVLAYSDLSCGFHLYTDTSQYAVGAVLDQEFDEGEKRYSVSVSPIGKGQQKWPTTERKMYG